MAKASRSGKSVTAQTTARLRQFGLRPTRQRVELAGLLFGDRDRHVTAESLHDEITKTGAKVSLATVYNTLHQFTEAGLLRQVIVDAARSYFDTNTGDHQHFFLEKEGMLIDIPGEAISVAGVPNPPPGLTVDRVDVVVRVKRA
ncbi:MAG TPA: Fur family transcriptional regulator [Rhizomicrobium sp.]|nr:Fur family transcriptional regulator [Rhizomicrobium sp.]